jgi:hypothetical protein
MSDYEQDNGGDVLLFDVKTRETTEILMPDLPFNYAAAYEKYTEEEA